jgi:hypothetical protein
VPDGDMPLQRAPIMDACCAACFGEHGISRSSLWLSAVSSSGLASQPPSKRRFAGCALQRLAWAASTWSSRGGVRRLKRVMTHQP